MSRLIAAGAPEAAPRPTRRRRGITLWCCGIVLAFTTLLVVTRIGGLDDGTLLALPMAWFPYAGLATLVALFLLLALRARRSALLAVVLVVIQLCWLVPRFVPAGTRVPPDAPRLRIGTSNSLHGGVDPRALVELVRSQRLDVLAVQELNHDGVRSLEQAGLHELMPHRELHPEADTSIYSRLPLSGAGLLARPTTWPQTSATVTVGGRAVRVIAVHTYYPLGSPGKWQRDMAELRAEAGRDVVVLGDFNATPDHAPMRAILDAGMIDTHSELGRGWAPTWPSGLALIQIDHVLHGAGLAGVSVSEHTLPDTDHRAIVAELAVVN